MNGSAHWSFQREVCSWPFTLWPWILLCVSRRNGSRACNLNFVACLRLTTERKAKNQEVLASHNHEFLYCYCCFPGHCTNLFSSVGLCSQEKPNCLEKYRYPISVNDVFDVGYYLLEPTSSASNASSFRLEARICWVKVHLLLSWVLEHKDTPDSVM